MIKGARNTSAVGTLVERTTLFCCMCCAPAFPGAIYRRTMATGYTVYLLRFKKGSDRSLVVAHFLLLTIG